MKNKNILTLTVVLLLCACILCFVACRVNVEQPEEPQETTYLITFKSNGGNYEIIKKSSKTTDAITMPQDPTRDGYSFGGWFVDEGTFSEPFTADRAITADIVVYAKWTIQKYTISYELNGGVYEDGVTNVSEYTVESEDITLAPLVRSGYAFDGWFVDGNHVETIKKGTTGNLVLSARWVKDGYSISYTNTKGAENNNPRTYTISDTAITLADLVKDGYTFDGWFVGDTKYTEIPANSTGNLTLEAKWSIVNYTITYRDPEGNALDVEGFDLPTTYTIESETIRLNTYYLAGYSFVGWRDSDGVLVTYIKKGAFGNLDLYGEFSDDRIFSIHFIDDQFGKSNPENPTEYIVGEESPEFKPLSKLDYKFLGWSYGFGNIVTEIDTRDGGDVYLYAVWEQKDEFKPFEYVVSENDDWCILTGVVDTGATSLVIPDVFDMIAPSALKYCSNLEELTLSYLSAIKGEQSNSYIGYLFGADNTTQNADVLPTSLKKVSLNGGTVGTRAFENAQYIEEINISESVTEIGENAFLECKSLKTLTTPVYLDGPSSSGRYDTGRYYGIHGSNGLTSYGDLALNIVGGEIGSYAFARSKSIKTLSVENVSKIDIGSFSACSNIESISIAGVQEIGAYAFYNCKSLTKAVLPEGVSALEAMVFAQCSSLLSITIPSTVESIEDNAFTNCYRLVEVYNYSKLSIVKGGSDNGHVGEYALDIYTTEENSKIVDNNGLIYHVNGNEKILLRYVGDVKNIEIEEGTYRIYRDAFNGSQIESVSFPDGLKIIDNNAFDGASQLGSVELPSSVTEIGEFAFANNPSLVNFNISACNLAELSKGLLSGCSGLCSVVIPSTVTRINERAFANCTQFGKGNNGSYVEFVLGANIEYIGSGAFMGCLSLSKITIPFIGSGDGTSHQLSHVFGGNNYPRISEVTVLSGANIAESAFEGFTGLQTVNMPTATEIGAKAFKDCNSLSTLIYSEQITQIGANAFEDTNLSSIIVPYIGSTIDDEIGKLGYFFGGDNGRVPRSLSKVVVLEGMTFVPESAFEGCSGIKEIVLPNSVTAIKKRAFANTPLNEYTLSENITEIGFGIFAGCDQMVSVTLPFIGDVNSTESTITHFGYAFGAETATDHRRADGTRAVPATLKNVTILAGTIKNEAFFRCNRIETITFGAGVTEITASAFIVSSYIGEDYYAVGATYWERYEHVLQSYNVVADNPNFKSLEGVLYSKDGKKLIAYPSAKSGENFVVPEGVEEICEYAFYAQRNLKNVNFGEDTAVISYQAFSGCGLLEKFEFGTKGALRELGGYLFVKCYYLGMDELVIPEGVKKLGDSSLSWVTMTKVVLPSTLCRIGIDALANENLQEAIFNTTKDWDQPGGLSTRPTTTNSRKILASDLQDPAYAASKLKNEGDYAHFTWVIEGYTEDE